MTGGKKTVLLLVEGFGLSSTKAGNSFLSANPKNFLNLWDSYGRTLIKPNILDASKDVFQEISSDFASLSSGSVLTHNQQFISDSIEEGSFYGNSVIGQMYEKVIQKNSALHLIGNLGDKNSRYGNVTHLLALLRWAKHRRIFRVYIHLVLDGEDFSNLSDVLSSLDHLESEIEKIGTGEIASVSGIDSIIKANSDTVLKAIVAGKGRSALSPEQAMARHGKKTVSVSAFPPSVITFRGKAIGKFNDFDNVVAFNHNPKKLERLLVALCSRRLKIMPRFVDTAAFFDNFLRCPDGLKIAFSRQTPNTLPCLLARNNISTLLLAGEKQRNNMEYFSGTGSNGVKTMLVKESSSKKDLATSFITNVFSEISKNIKSYDLLVVDYHLLWESAKSESLRETVKSIETFDKMLHQLANFILQIGGNLIVTSPFGYLEQMSSPEPYSKINLKSKNPLPFLLISSISNKRKFPGGIGDQMIYDMLKIRHEFVDIAPTLLRLFGVPQPAGMRGQSFLDELINH